MLHALHPIVSTLAVPHSVLHLFPRILFILHRTKKGKKKSAEIRFGKEQHWKCLTLCIKHGNSFVLSMFGFRWISVSS